MVFLGRDGEVKWEFENVFSQPLLEWKTGSSLFCLWSRTGKAPGRQEVGKMVEYLQMTNIPLDMHVSVYCSYYSLFT